MRVFFGGKNGEDFGLSDASLTRVVELAENSTKLISTCDRMFEVPRGCYLTTI